MPHRPEAAGAPPGLQDPPAQAQHLGAHAVSTPSPPVALGDRGADWPCFTDKGTEAWRKLKDIPKAGQKAAVQRALAPGSRLY